MNKAFLIFTIGLVSNIICFGQLINNNRLDSLLKKAEMAHSEAVIIYQNNKLITEKYWGVGRADRRIEAMSCTKSIVGLAMACILTDKLIDSLDVPVYVYYPEWKQGQKQQITLRHLVNMTSGMQNLVPTPKIEIYSSPDFVQLALAAELSNTPGEVFSYNNKSINLLAGIIKKITGKRMDVYIGKRLFKPLGITDFEWRLDNAGNPHAMAGCKIKPADFVKLGLLVLNKGKYNNEQIIAEEFINALTTPCKQFAMYGMLWWIDYEKTNWIVDDEVITGLVSAGMPQDFIENMKKMKGKYSKGEFTRQFKTVFGKNPEFENGVATIDHSQRKKNPPLYKPEYWGQVSYRASGDLGNYIIVDPNTNIVAIRMISRDSNKAESDYFNDFKKMVLALTKPTDDKKDL